MYEACRKRIPCSGGIDRIDLEPFDPLDRTILKTDRALCSELYRNCRTKLAQLTAGRLNIIDTGQQPRFVFIQKQDVRMATDL